MTTPERKLISIEEDDTCLETFPCQHTEAKFTYSDGTTEIRHTDGFEVLDICTKNNIPLPPHFSYMEDFKKNISINN
jgi:hypothetical protein